MKQFQLPLDLAATYFSAAHDIKTSDVPMKVDDVRIPLVDCASNTLVLPDALSLTSLIDQTYVITQGIGQWVYTKRHLHTVMRPHQELDIAAEAFGHYSALHNTYWLLKGKDTQEESGIAHRRFRAAMSNTPGEGFRYFRQMMMPFALPLSTDEVTADMTQQLTPTNMEKARMIIARYEATRPQIAARYFIATAMGFSDIAYKWGQRLLDTNQKELTHMVAQMQLADVSADATQTGLPAIFMTEEK